MIASQSGDQETVQLLLDTAGALIDMADNFGGTLLHAALEMGNGQVVKLALKRGDVNKAAHDGDTPLHAPSEGGQVEIVKLLLYGGEPIKATDKLGATALDVARG